MPKVSIIIVNYNGSSYLKECLQSLEKQSFPDFEIIIVDNGSLDSSLAEIKKFKEKSILSSKMRVITLNENRGFTGGNIEGLKSAGGKYIALLNNDTEPDNKWLGVMVEAMDKHSDVGICASRMLTDMPGIIDSAGDGFSPLLKAYKRGEGKDSAEFNNAEYIFGACGGAALYRKKMIDEIGFFDDLFFIIYEDSDLSLRAHLKGWKVLYVPSAIVKHKVSATIRKMSDLQVYYSLRNSEMVKIKNIPLSLLLKYSPLLLLGSLAELYYFGIKHKNLSIYFKAKRDVLKNLPLLLQKRRKILKSRTVDNSYLTNLITPVWNKDFSLSKLEKLFHD